MECVDGTRELGYGRYRDDSRWLLSAEDIVRHVRLKAADWVLDVGRGNEFLVTDLMKVSPGLDGFGTDKSGQRALISMLRRLRRLFRHEP